MSFEQINDWISKAIADHWLEGAFALIALLVGRYWGRRRAMRDWRRREFLNRLMFSLNSVVLDGAGKPTLAIRTLLEKNVGDVFLNEVATHKVLDAATKTTEENPLLPFDGDDRWTLLNAVLNEVAEAFCAGTLARDMGVPVETRRYVICLTNEVAGPVRTRKVRAMVVRKDRLLDRVFEGDLALESPHHVTRIATLRRMREAYEQTPDQFLELDLALPSGRSETTPSRAATAPSAPTAS